MLTKLAPGAALKQLNARCLATAYLGASEKHFAGVALCHIEEERGHTQPKNQLEKGQQKGAGMVRAESHQSMRDREGTCRYHKITFAHGLDRR